MVKPIENQSLSNGPAVKKLLKEHDLDESSIDGSGKDGRITKADIVNHLDESSENTKNEQKIHSPASDSSSISSIDRKREGADV